MLRMNSLPVGRAVLIETQLADAIEPWVHVDEGWRKLGHQGPEGRPLSDGARDEAEVRGRVRLMLGDGTHVAVLRGINTYPMAECWALRLMIIESDLHEAGEEVWAIADERSKLLRAFVPPKPTGPRLTPTQIERALGRRLGDICWAQVRSQRPFDVTAIKRAVYRGLLEERLDAGDKRAIELAELVPA